MGKWTREEWLATLQPMAQDELDGLLADVDQRSVESDYPNFGYTTVARLIVTIRRLVAAADPASDADILARGEKLGRQVAQQTLAEMASARLISWAIGVWSRPQPLRRPNPPGTVFRP